MRLNHVAVFCSTEKKSDAFYCDLLGLEKVNSRILPKDLIEKIFGISTELKMINYASDDVRFEVFVGKDNRLGAHKIGHVCLEVDDREAFRKKCEAMKVHQNKIPKDDSFILFISDDAGNLFEIKEKPKNRGGIYERMNYK